MQFTPQEMKLIERLRKEERKWPRTRWVVLIGCILVGLMQGYILWKVMGHLQSIEPDSLFWNAGLYLFVLQYPKCLILFFLASLGVGWSIRNWHGNVNNMLLLKLLDAQSKEPPV